MVVVSTRAAAASFSYHITRKFREFSRYKQLPSSSITRFWAYNLRTPKFRETVSELRYISSTTRLIKVQTQEQQPFNSLRIVEETDEESCKNKKLPESNWVISIREKLNKADEKEEESSWAKLCIYRVPHCLREGDNKAFMPQILSLGPFHHGNGRLPQMETHKWRCLNHILKRYNHDVKIYLDAMKKLEKEARECYEGSISLTSDAFAEMMVLDSCFVLELFRGTVEGFEKLGYSKNDPIFATRATMHSIRRDMIMLENQIPLFILDLLLGLQSGNPSPRGTVETLTLAFFDPLLPTERTVDTDRKNQLEPSLGQQDIFHPLRDNIGLHCLDVFRRSLLRDGPIPEPSEWGRWWSAKRVADKRRQQLIHCVTELKEAGINFKRRKTDRFWDIKFQNGVLQIPRLLIHDGTKSLFLNLIAFEQCHLNSSNDITSYVVFMDNLINSNKDVEYLHYCGIIEHMLGSDAEVANLFNRLCQEVVINFDDSYLSEVSEHVNRYYNNRWNAWRARFKHKYFSNPWAIVSLLAKTIYQHLSNYRPK